MFEELKMDRYTVSQMTEQMVIPPNIQMMLDTDNQYWVAYRYIKEEERWVQFIVLDEQTMIWKCNGLWYLIKRMS